MNYDIDRFIPLDKSWMMRVGCLDIFYGGQKLSGFLKEYKKKRILGDDLQALERCAKVWDSYKTLDVGESGTFLRFLQFFSWKSRPTNKFRLRGTLVKRAASSICDDPEIVLYAPKKTVGA